MLVYVAFLALICASFASDSGQPGQSACNESDWMKLSQQPVCLEAKGNIYGSLMNNVQAGRVSAIKLEYVSGAVRCIWNSIHNSRWGCDYDPIKDNPLNIIVTDDKDNVLFPKQEYIKQQGPLWYWSPFVNVKNSNEIIFSDNRMPFYFPLNKELRVWYGEDLKNWDEGDNAGRVCVNVYAKFMP